MIGGMRIIQDATMVDTVEDWSRVRSPGRALRRRSQGHRQNIAYRTVPKTTVYTMGNTMVMHPAVAAQLTAQIPQCSRTDGRQQISVWPMF